MSVRPDDAFRGSVLLLLVVLMLLGKMSWWWLGVYFVVLGYAESRREGQ